MREGGKSLHRRRRIGSGLDSETSRVRRAQGGAGYQLGTQAWHRSNLNTVELVTTRIQKRVRIPFSFASHSRSSLGATGRTRLWVPLVVPDQCASGAIETLVGYDQWHPEMITRAKYCGIKESQFLVSAAIDVNSMVLGLTSVVDFGGSVRIGRGSVAECSARRWQSLGFGHDGAELVEQLVPAAPVLVGLLGYHQ